MTDPLQTPNSSDEQSIERRTDEVSMEYQRIDNLIGEEKKVALGELLNENKSRLMEIFSNGQTRDVKWETVINHITNTIIDNNLSAISLLDFINFDWSKDETFVRYFKDIFFGPVEIEAINCGDESYSLRDDNVNIKLLRESKGEAFNLFKNLYQGILAKKVELDIIETFKKWSENGVQLLTDVRIWDNTAQGRLFVMRRNKFISEDKYRELKNLLKERVESLISSRKGESSFMSKRVEFSDENIEANIMKIFGLKPEREITDEVKERISESPLYNHFKVAMEAMNCNHLIKKLSSPDADSVKMSKLKSELGIVEERKKYLPVEFRYKLFEIMDGIINKRLRFKQNLVGNIVEDLFMNSYPELEGKPFTITELENIKNAFVGLLKQ